MIGSKKVKKRNKLKEVKSNGFEYNVICWWEKEKDREREIEREREWCQRNKYYEWVVGMSADEFVSMKELLYYQLYEQV